MKRQNNTFPDRLYSFSSKRKSMVQTLSPPMTMADFFEASRGTWLNRRAVHHHDYQDDEAADSNLVIEPFNADDPVVTKICNSLNIKTEDSSGGEQRACLTKSRGWLRRNQPSSSAGKVSAPLVCALKKIN